MLRKVTVIAILIALVLASFPTFGVLAKSEINNSLEKKWDQLVTNFNNQNFNHGRMHKLVDNWLKTNKIAKAADRAEVQRHLAVCSSAIESAAVIVATRAGFDSDGKIIDRALARKSIEDLTYYLQLHAGSVRSLKGHMS